MRKIVFLIAVLISSLIHDAHADYSLSGRVFNKQGWWNRPALLIEVEPVEAPGQIIASTNAGDEDGFFNVIVPAYSAVQENHIPESFDLKQNYPNPFNPSTIIEYQLPRQSEVSLSVFNMMGQKVRTLMEGVQPAGLYQVTWDGTNETGNPVSAGIYIYRIKTALESKVRKMALIDGSTPSAIGTKIQPLGLKKENSTTLNVMLHITHSEIDDLIFGPVELYPDDNNNVDIEVDMIPRIDCHEPIQMYPNGSASIDAIDVINDPDGPSSAFENVAGLEIVQTTPEYEAYIDETTGNVEITLIDNFVDHRWFDIWVKQKGEGHKTAKGEIQVQVEGRDRVELDVFDWKDMQTDQGELYIDMKLLDRSAYENNAFLPPLEFTVHLQEGNRTVYAAAGTYDITVRDEQDDFEWTPEEPLSLEGNGVPKFKLEEIKKIGRFYDRYFPQVSIQDHTRLPVMTIPEAYNEDATMTYHAMTEFDLPAYRWQTSLYRYYNQSGTPKEGYETLPNYDYCLSGLEFPLDLRNEQVPYFRTHWIDTGERICIWTPLDRTTQIKSFSDETSNENAIQTFLESIEEVVLEADPDGTFIFYSTAVSHLKFKVGFFTWGTEVYDQTLNDEGTIESIEMNIIGTMCSQYRSSEKEAAKAHIKALFRTYLLYGLGLQGRLYHLPLPMVYAYQSGWARNILGQSYPIDPLVPRSNSTEGNDYKQAEYYGINEFDPRDIANMQFFLMYPTEDMSTYLID